MPLPKQVQRQAAEADQLVHQFNGTEPAEATPPEPTPATPPQQAQPAPQPPAPVPAPVAQPPAGNEWETRYHTLQGKYNAEVPALQGQLQNALTAMSNMGRELDNVKAQLVRAQATPPVQPSKLTPQDETTWGGDMLDMVRRGAQEEAAKLMQPLMQENAELKAQLAQVQGQTQEVVQSQQTTRESMFWARLLELSPDWQRLNTDQGFLQWLGQYDPMMVGYNSRQEALNAVVQGRDATRAAAFFNAYKATLPPPVVPNPQQELQRQITPRASRAQAPAAAAGGQPQTVEIWSQEEIMQFYTDVNRGRWRHDPNGQAEMRARIDQAVAEGRVR